MSTDQQNAGLNHPIWQLVRGLQHCRRMSLNWVLAIITIPQAALSEIPCELTEETELLAWDTAPHDYFGQSVDMTDDQVAIVAAHNRPSMDVSHAGAAYVYRYSDADEAWHEDPILVASDGQEFDVFGSAVAIEEHTAMVGAPGAREVYVFEFDEPQWIEKQKLSTQLSSSRGEFGAALANSNGLLVVGAPGDDDGGSNAGSAIVFRDSGTAWVKEFKLQAQDFDSWTYFGSSVAISGDVIVAGAHRADGAEQETGAACIFRRACAADDTCIWNQEAKLLGAWGSADSTTDLNGDGVVDIDDLTLLLAGWGPC